MKVSLPAVGTADWLLYAAYTVMSVAGLTLIKQFLPALQQGWRSGGLPHTSLLCVAFGAALYVASFLVWLAILSRMELSVAYPIAIGLTLVFATLSAAFLLGEQISALRLAGILVVFAGIVMITRG